MNFGFTEEQELLRAEVRKFLDQNCSLEEVRKLAATESGYSRDFWMRMAELGWVGLTFPEAHGGVGLGWEDLVVVLEETGRTLFPSPLIATVLAGNAITRLGDAAQQKRWLPKLASGAAIGTFAHLEAGDAQDPAAIALRGRRDGDGFALDGEKLFVPDAGSADLFVVAFRTGDAPDALALGVVERGAKGVSAVRDATMDETKRTGRLRLDGVRIGRDALLGEPGRAGAAISRILDEGALAVTAEAVGAAEAVHQLTTHYAKQRIQFDKPIGQFQGVKHPLAVAYVDIESWRSLAYYAAWALDSAPADASLAVSRAKSYASEAFPRIGIEAIQLHGGIGYTWEYDAQLYLKRAKWMRPAFGDATNSTTNASRPWEGSVMDFNLTPAEEAFREEVRAFIREHAPKNRGDVAAVGKWHKKVRAKRWVGFSWPKEYGGGGGSVMEQAILKEEMSKAQAPPLGSCFMGLAWVGPAIIEYGTDEQKKQFIPDILDGKYQWCTGYSEPDSGSDLASLQCKAVRDGDHYVVNGQKIWTSIAMWSKWMILLVRTQMQVAAKHDGITCLLVPMDTPGITVRPIKNMAGGAMFAEVFFDAVRVPVANRLGAEGRGWGVTVSALAHERSSIAEVQGLLRSLEDVKALAQACVKNGRPASEDPGIRRRIAKIDARIEAMRLCGLRFLTKQLRGEPLGSETSINKLIRAELEIEIGELALEIQGSRGPLWKGSDLTPEDGRWQRMALSWPEVVIGGGTPNIQKNIIAERVLGLPKD